MLDTMKILPLLIAALVLTAPTAAHAGDLTTEELVRTLRERSRPYFARFKGVRAVRTITSKELDPDTGELKKLKEFKVDLWSHFYLKPARKILSCKVDGKAEEPGACEPRGDPKAVLPLFDERSAENYRFELLGKKTVQGIPCYKLKIIPLKKTDQHMSGVMYFSVDKLESVLLEGTMAKLPFPLKRFFIKLRFGRKDGFPVVTRGYLDIEVKVAVFYHVRMVNRFTETRHRFLPR